MRKNIKNTSLAVVAGFFVVAIALSFGRSTFAQAVEGTALETQISNLVSTLEKVFLQEEKSGAGAVVINAVIPSGVPNPTCIDNYQSWSHSNTYLVDADWNLDFIPRIQYSSTANDATYTNEQFVDLNGDGLSDYIYKYRKYWPNAYANDFTEDATCVYLNNGAGFDKAYRCYAYVVSEGTPSQDYYGDCADMSQ